MLRTQEAKCGKMNIKNINFEKIWGLNRTVEQMKVKHEILHHVAEIRELMTAYQYLNDRNLGFQAIIDSEIKSHKTKIRNHLRIWKAFMRGGL